MSTAPVLQAEMHVSSARSLLIDRMGVLLRSACRGIGAGLARWKKQAGRRTPAAHGGLLAAMMGRALTAKNARGRMLAIEERLTLGPKQHMYLIRCGEQRLLVASAGEAALQWMALPDDSGFQPEAVAATKNADGSETKQRAKRRTASSRTETGGKGRSPNRTAGMDGMEGAR